MTGGPVASSEEPLILGGEDDEYFCPVCGIGLAKSDFDTPAKHTTAPTAALGRRLRRSGLRGVRSRLADTVRFR